MSDTPRTDAIAHRGLQPGTYISEMTELARQLERELSGLALITGQRIQALEIELAEASNDFHCLADLLDGHDATECRANLVKLKSDLAQCKAGQDEIYKAAVDLAAKLEDDLAEAREMIERLKSELAIARF